MGREGCGVQNDNRERLTSKGEEELTWAAPTTWGMHA